mgnify:FL=1
MSYFQGQFRMLIRTCWIAYTGFWFIGTIGWFFVVLQWVLLGAVLNPVAVLAHSVAVGSSFGFLLKMWTSGISRMRRLRLKIRKNIEAKFRTLLNRPGGALHRKLIQTMGNKKKKFKTIPVITPKIAFRLFDRNGDKKLTFEEFRNLLENMNLKLSESRALKIFAASDKGKLGFHNYN